MKLISHIQPVAKQHKCIQNYVCSTQAIQPKQLSEKYGLLSDIDFVILLATETHSLFSAQICSFCWNATKEEARATRSAHLAWSAGNELKMWYCWTS